VQEMRWSEINWQQNSWRIPETKNGEVQIVPLSPAAVRILEKRKAATKNEWVFPSSGKTGHLVEPKIAWRRLLAQAAAIQKEEWVKTNPDKDESEFQKENPNAGFRDLRLHDLRRTLGSWQAATGASLTIIGKSLGHKSLAATQIYARLNLDPVRSSKRGDGCHVDGCWDCWIPREVRGIASHPSLPAYRRTGHFIL